MPAPALLVRGVPPAKKSCDTCAPPPSRSLVNMLPLLPRAPRSHCAQEEFVTDKPAPGKEVEL